MIKKTTLLSSVAFGSLLALSLTQSAKAAVFDFSWNNSGGTFEDPTSRDSELGDGLSASGTITLDDAVGDGGSFTIADITDLLKICIPVWKQPYNQQNRFLNPVLFLV